MPNIEIPSWVSELYNTGFALARILAVAAFVVSVILVARRKPRLFLAVAFLASSVAMAGVAWHLRYVTNTEPILVTIHGPISDINPANDYSTFQTVRPSELVLVLAALLLGFLVAQVILAARAKRVLTTGAGIVAIIAFLVVAAEFIRALGDVFSPLWTNMNEVSAVLWTVLFFAALGYVVFAGFLLTHRLTLRRERSKTPVSAAPAPDLTGATTAH